MKNSLLKQSVFILLTLSSLFSLFTSCKKEAADDPNIIYTALNITFANSNGVSQMDSIDINLDTKNDFMVYSGFTGTGDSAAAYIIGDDAAAYIDSTYKYGSVIYKANALSKGQTPELINTQRRWSTYAYIGLKLGAAVSGYPNGADIYVPVIVRNSSSLKYHYGWVRVNLSSDFKTYKVIDAAYNIIPETPIAMGAK